ncbi:uncharacterized protein LOC112571424 isoform X3 [Pomacea canaliculata]|uniref:uncharacterized protein LOC112571424 isoform X3 n=1 Tax=Pomacea canaliculata TaxID=400727 RepID=UPI000D725CDE|nr:uncharacterized protein LOC112571424 isoform X3 [Pomacea canaliculata]
MEDEGGIPQLNQEELDELAATLDIQYAILDNLTGGHDTYTAAITIANKGETQLQFGNWAIYFSHIRMIEPEHLPCKGGVNLPGGLNLCHINGCLFQLKPTPLFLPVRKGESIIIPIKGQYYSVSRTDIFPNWYIAADGLTPKVIACTANETLDFVAAFDKPWKWKRFDYIAANGKARYDFYDPYSPDIRFKKNDTEDLGKAGKLVLPTPARICMTDSDSPKELQFDARKWLIYSDMLFQKEASYLAGKIGASAVTTNTSEPSTCSVILTQGDISVNVHDKHLHNTEAYHLQVDGQKQQVHISARTSSGIFWGIQTLLSMTTNGTLPVVSIQDAPRLSHRGNHVDVARNFHCKETIMRLLEVMASYKLNVLHLHLTDDEGWRIQIPGLEELTEHSSKRSHDLMEESSLLPLLGSGPTACPPGSGYFTVQDYQEILMFAAERHIEVIPEIDMPGHCHAAIRAMQARYARLKAAGDDVAAEEYLLSDRLASVHTVQSVQMFSENSLNPGLPSTFQFIRKVMQEIQALHKDIQPLRVFHLGGDEVPYQAWEESPACRWLIETGEVASFKDLMTYFVLKVAEIAKDLCLSVSAWQDGIVYQCHPFPRSDFPNKEVIMTPGTHMYFDHPQEPDPEERGLYWACRYTDTRKVFEFAPQNLFSNADVRLTGEPITSEDLKEMLFDPDFEPLEKPGNIVGLQGQLWTEVIRTAEQFDNMVYPRLLALAERAWHEAEWEHLSRDNGQRKKEQEEDWRDFSNTLGYKELGRLDACSVKYYLPPPGGRCVFCRLSQKGLLELNCQIPGLPIMYCFNLEGDQDWKTYFKPLDVSGSEMIYLRTCSNDGKRVSRTIKMMLGNKESESK